MRTLTEAVRLCDPHNEHKLTFWILFNAICSLYYSTVSVWSSSETVGLYSLDENAVVVVVVVVVFPLSLSHVRYVITQKHRFGHSHCCLNGSRRFEEFLPPLTSLTVFSAVLDSRKVISRDNATYFMYYRDTRACVLGRGRWEM